MPKLPSSLLSWLRILATITALLSPVIAWVVSSEKARSITDERFSQVDKQIAELKIQVKDNSDRTRNIELDLREAVTILKRMEKR